MRRLLRVLAVLALLGLGGLLLAGEYLSAPRPAAIGAPPPALHAQPVRIGQVAGWMRRGQPGHGVVLLLHGIRADRRQMQDRALFLARRGYGVLLIDLPGQGESQAERITFGANESRGVLAALAYLEHEQPGERIGVIGVSLGAASLAIARPGTRVAAAVLESMYPTIEEAVGNRLEMRLGPFGRQLAPLLLKQLPLRLNVAPADLRPIDALRGQPFPVLIAAGARDVHTTAAETQRIFEAAAQPKALWLVEGAAHVDLHAYATDEYEARVGAFMAAHLVR